MSALSTDNPFVGLRPFESNESLLFFGRQEQTMELLNRLHHYNFVAVTGTSGSGKSSLIRAGLIPKLQAGYLVNNRDTWMIAICKPGQSPLCNLAEELLIQVPNMAGSTTAAELETQLKTGGIQVLTALIKPALNSHASLFILVDQFEEIFRFSMNDADLAKREEAILFVQLLLQLARQKDLPVYVTLTMRSDFVGDCTQIHNLPEALNESQYLVPRPTRQQLKSSIEGPVKLYGGTINNGLTARLLNDVSMVKDELPLIQHALMRLWERAVSLGKVEMTVEDYEVIGGLTKALSKDAQKAMQGMNPGEQLLTEKMFKALTGIDEKGRKIRRPVKMSELVTLTNASQEQLQQIIDRFIADSRNFLVTYTSQDTTEVYIDISHESLIRQWDTLNHWVDDEAEAAAGYMRLVQAWQFNTNGSKDVLTGNELLQMQQWYRQHQPTAEWAVRYSQDFTSHVAYLHKSEEAARKDRWRKKRNRLLVYATAFVIFLIVSAFAIYINQNNNHNKRQLALNYWNSSQSARLQSNNLEALHLLGEAAIMTDDSVLNKDLLVDAYAFMPLTALQNIIDVGTIINSVAFSNDGSLMVTAGNDGTAKIYYTATGKQEGKPIKSELPLMSACFNKDASRVLTCGNDQTARIWNTTNGKGMILLQHSASVNSAAFNKDETKILTASSDGKAIEWDAKTGRKLIEYEGTLAILNAAYSNNGKMIATAGEDFTATLWTVGSSKPLFKFPHNGAVTSASFSNNDSLLLTTSRDSIARLWDVETQTEVARFKHEDAVTSAAFHPNQKSIVVGCADKKARIWDLTTLQQTGAGMQHRGRIYSVAFSTDGKWLATAGRDETIRLWKVQAPVKESITVLRHNAMIVTASYSNNGQKIVTASMDSTATIWDAKTGKRLLVMQHKDEVNTAVFSTDGKFVVTASKDSSAYLWNSTTGEQVARYAMESPVNCAALNAEHTLLVTTANNKTLLLWNVGTKSILKRTTTKEAYRGAAFSKDGKSILLTGKDSSAYIFDLDLKEKPVRLHHENLITSATYNTNGNLIATTSDDMTARIWDVITMQQTGSNLQHKAGVRSVAFNNTGHWCVTGGWDFRVYVWSLTNYRELGIARHHSAPITRVAFDPEGNYILSAGYDSLAIIWPVPGDVDLPADLLLLQIKATTGTSYNFAKGETECLSSRQWKKFVDEYQTKSVAHAKQCRHAVYNFWNRAID